MKPTPLIVLATLSLACSKTGDGTSSSSSSSSSSSGSSEGETTDPTGATDSATTDSNPPSTTDSATSSTAPDPTTSGPTTDGGSSSGGGTGVFVQEPDGGTAQECDIWAQDCPTGQKCMPWADDGGGAWNATKCTPVSPNPNQVGDPCTTEGGGTSGADDCDVAAMCWNVDGETGIGTCVDFCTGSPASPECEDPGDVCLITNEGSLILCLPICDPILQNCGTNEGCYLVDGITITCGPDSSGAGGIYGDPCEFDNSCDPGLYCAPADTVPDCVGAAGCCSQWCDLTTSDPSSVCGGLAGGQECVSYYDPGTAPPGFDHVGLCAIPQ